MKTLIALTSALFLASAFAALAAPIPDLQCWSKNVADSGYDLDVQVGRTSADLYDVTIAGRNLIGRLACRSGEDPRADRPVNILTCAGQAKGLGNVIARIYGSGNEDKPTASLRQVARDGSEREVQFGTLQCAVGER